MFNRDKPWHKDAHYPVVLLFCAAYILVTNSLGKELGDLIFQGLVMLLLPSLIVEVLSIKEKLSGGRGNKNSKAFIVKANHCVIGEVFSTFTQKLDHAIQVEKDIGGFSVNNEWWAIDSYEIFWEKLLEAQKIYPREEWCCYAIHSCDIGIWEEDHNPKASLFYRFHETFIKNGGKVRRILCGEGKDPNSRYQKVADKMRSVKVDVLYYDRNCRKVGHSFTWDFLVVDKTKQAVLWCAFDLVETKPREARYRIDGVYDEKSLLDLWKEIEACSFPFPADSSTV